MVYFKRAALRRCAIPKALDSFGDKNEQLNFNLISKEAYELQLLSKKRCDSDKYSGNLDSRVLSFIVV